MRTRLFFSFLAVIFITLSSVAYFAQQGALREVRNFMFRGGMIGAEELVVELEEYHAQHGGWAGVEQLLLMPPNMGPMHMGPDMSGFRLADAGGNLIVPLAANAPGEIPPEELEQAIPLEAGGQTVGYLLPQSGFAAPPHTSEIEIVGRLARASWNAALLAGLIALALALVSATLIVKPVQQLTEAAAKMAAGDLSQRVDARSRDELGRLAETFNGMAASLERAEASRQEMTADIAHELRTPLAVQRANLEALQDGLYPLNVENLKPIVDQNQLLTRLVDDLRTLALADADQLALEKRPTDISKLTRELGAQFTARAVGKHVSVQVDAEDETSPVNIDPDRIEQVLHNLLDNALRHTPEGGSIGIVLREGEGHVEVAVEDSGPGIPEEALPHVFERFYRADVGRSREQGGNGLGLTIARQLVELHGGELRAANRPEGGAVFTVRLGVESWIEH